MSGLGKTVAVLAGGVSGTYVAGMTGSASQTPLVGSTIAADTARDYDVYVIGSGIIQVVNSHGFLRTYAGTGVSGYSGDGGLATAAQLSSPGWPGIAVGPAGALYVFDNGNNVIRRIDFVTKIITRVAGTPNQDIPNFGTGNGGSALLAVLSKTLLGQIAVSSLSEIYFLADKGIQKIDAAGVLSIVCGNQTVPMPVNADGDGGLATAINCDGSIQGVALDDAGKILYVTHNGWSKIRAIDLTTNIITTAIGNGINNPKIPGLGGPAVDGMLFLHTS